MNSDVGYCVAVITIWLSILGSAGAVYGNPAYFPEPNPPWAERDIEMTLQHQTVARAVRPSVEWKYHKTPDNRHPDGNEQQLMWLMNRARSNPTVEGIWLANIYDQYITYVPRCNLKSEDIDFCYIAAALDYWHVDLDRLQTEFAGYDTYPPAAFDVRLYRAAKTHSKYLISIDDQNHTNQFDRITDENFSFIRARGNVFSYTLSALYGHAAFNIDWGDGDDGSGMQTPRGHRIAIMAIDGDYPNVGIAAVSESDSATTVGPLVVTGNYCEANTARDNHYNRFLVGTVWTDKDDDSIYDPGEGIDDVMVMPDQGVFYAITSRAGGYALPITAAGTYEITFSGVALNGAALNSEVVKTVVIGNESVLLDLVDDSNTSSSVDDAGDEGDEGGGGGGGGCFITAIPLGFAAAKGLGVGVTIYFCSIILIGSAALDKRKPPKPDKPVAAYRRSQIFATKCTKITTKVITRLQFRCIKD